jgi:8-oxo-dGTP pyrophosphatase MutT (NUDIX family)
MSTSKIIYVENNKIFLGNTINIEDGAHKLIGGIQAKDLYYVIEDMLSHKEDIQIVDNNLSANELLNLFKKELVYIRAGGGWVTNKQNEVLWIYRNDKWDLPKGKLDDKDENISSCALREVKEETGLYNLELNELLTTTYHIYKLKQRFVLKQTDWFRMEADKEILKPQVEEGITACKWLSPKEAEACLANTYLSIRDVYFTALQR